MTQPSASRPVAISWARGLKRVYGVEIESCTRCGGELKIIASIAEPQLIAKILSHLERAGAQQSPSELAPGGAGAAGAVEPAVNLRMSSDAGLRRENEGTMRKLLGTVVFVSMLAALLAHSANAGLFSTAVSDENAKDLKHIGISSSLGHKLQGQQVGLTVFGNRHFEVDLPDWALDAEVRKQLMEEIPASGRLTATLEPWEGVPAGNYKAMLEAARQRGFDAVLAIEATENPNDRLLPAGPSLLHKKALGLDRVHVCNSIRAAWP